MSDSSIDRHTSQDLGQFWKSWFKDPKLIGAVAPSGRALAKLMSTGLKPGARVIELGAGTGTVTDALLATGVRPGGSLPARAQRGVLRDPVAPLPAQPARRGGRARSARAVRGPARHVRFRRERAAAAACSSRSKRRSSSSRSSRCSGRTARISSSRMVCAARSTRNRARLKLKRKLLGWAALNIPPAFVYRFTRA